MKRGRRIQTARFVQSTTASAAVTEGFIPPAILESCTFSAAIRQGGADGESYAYLTSSSRAPVLNNAAFPGSDVIAEWKIGQDTGKGYGSAGGNYSIPLHGMIWPGGPMYLHTFCTNAATLSQTYEALLYYEQQ